MIKRKKLTDVEVEAAVNGIRKKYNDYMVEFLKPSTAKSLFEDRYIDALKARIDLDRFILNEITLVQTLINEEKAKREEESLKKEKHQKKVSKKESQSIAERIFSENREKIKKYTGCGLDDEDVYEVNKLFGAVKNFEKIYWSEIEKILRKLYTSRYSGPRMSLEERLFEITIPGPDGFPPALIKLRTILDRSPREYSAIQRESQRCILLVSFFLHSLYEVLDKIKEDGALKVKERKQITDTMSYVHDLIEDFRLTDLTSSNFKGGK